MIHSEQSVGVDQIKLKIREFFTISANFTTRIRCYGDFYKVFIILFGANPCILAKFLTSRFRINQCKPPRPTAICVNNVMQIGAADYLQHPYYWVIPHQNNQLWQFGILSVHFRKLKIIEYGSSACLEKKITNAMINR